MELYRTPDDAFDHCPDFPWEPSYAEVRDPDGGTLARVNANDCMLTATATRASELEHFKQP